MMNPWKRKRTAHYNLAYVQQLVRNGDIDVTNKALDCAWRHFGWEYSDIKDAICHLKLNKHFYKSEPHRVIPGVVVDIYKARKLKGENVYIHFHIDYDNTQERIVLSSFKQLEE